MATRRVALGHTGETVRENIARLRKEQRMTLRDLAERLEESDRPLAHNTLSEIERGARRVDVDDLMAIAIALDASPMSLLMPDVTDENDEVQATGTTPIAAQYLWSFLEGYRSLRGGGLSFFFRSHPRTILRSDAVRSVSWDDRSTAKIDRRVRTDGDRVESMTGIGDFKPLSEELANGNS
jgi:transcriptional regulator with XRE-family HTH domain